MQPLRTTGKVQKHKGAGRARNDYRKVRWQLDDKSGTSQLNTYATSFFSLVVGTAVSFSFYFSSYLEEFC